MAQLKPLKEVPDFEIETLEGTWNLKENDDYYLIVFYRGSHCPVCRKYLSQLNGLIDEFGERNVKVICISADGKENAQETQKSWDVDNLTLGYDLSEEKAREWGLFISKSINGEEKDTFSEPGLFFIKPDNYLYFSSVQTMPFSRPDFNQLLKSIDYIFENDYPARGGA